MVVEAADALDRHDGGPYLASAQVEKQSDVGLRIAHAEPGRITDR